MALLYRRESTSDEQPLYTLSQQKVVLVVGLGNAGKEYDGTRHNVGFACVDYFAKNQGFPKWIEKVDLKCHLSDAQIGDHKVILIKPTTYMNESGQAVSAVQRFYKLNNKQTLVIHDELDLPFGQIRTRMGGGAAGNNGIKSLLKHLDENFSRVRVGIQNDQAEQIDSSNFVLAKFTGDERKLLPKIINEVSTIISEFTATGQVPHQTKNISDLAT